MSDTKPVKGAGAPLRIFFLVTMIWILGRIAWASNATDVPIVYIEGIGDLEHSIMVGALEMESMDARSNSIFWKWSQGQQKITEFDFIEFDVEAFEYLPAWSRQSLVSNQLAAKLVKQSGGAFPLVAIFDGAGTGFKQSELCCGEQAKGISRTKAVFSLDTDQTPNAKQSSALSAYFWFFARAGSSLTNPFSTALQPGSAQYGGSQTGAIFSFRLAGDRGRNVAVYSRVSSPLAVKGAGEIAIGAKAKPISGLPISLYAERRFREGQLSGSGTALFAAGGSGPDEIMRDVFLETYGQAGYVFQDDDSYFFDGSASVQRKLATVGTGKISLGGAVWAGGQEGVRRFDIGPRINIDAPFKNLQTRVSVDWRQRVAGNAEPGSGLAVSLSTGF